MNYQTTKLKLEENSGQTFDFLIIGGGATGVGIALDAASRGFKTILCEQKDFGCGTSSRSTKLAHGGVRYLQQGNISLVKSALKERGLMRKNAPHLVRDLPFVLPTYKWWEKSFYGIGLKVYDFLAGKLSFGKSRNLSKNKVIELLPTINKTNLHGGVLYHDGQFDDSRLLISLARSAEEKGAILLNYTQVKSLIKNDDGKINGAFVVDIETGVQSQINARCVINATGPFSDSIIKMDAPGATDMIEPSQGVHLVFDKNLLPGKTALIVPKTSDGRVLFAIPWHNHTLVGTTDTLIEKSTLEPQAKDEEIEFIITTVNQYFDKQVSRKDVLSVFTGIRPLVNPHHGKNSGKTSAISRDHTIHTSDSGLITVTGGKWTTYRHMAEDAVNHAIETFGLENRPCQTENMRLYGYLKNAQDLGNLYVYGSDAEKIKELIKQEPTFGEIVCQDPKILAAQVVWAVRHEMAKQVEDVLARRTRALFLNSKQAVNAAPKVAKIMAKELSKDDAWQSQQIHLFNELAKNYAVDVSGKGANRDI